MADRAIDFWFSTGSTYTYLTVSRLPKLAEAEGVTFNWRPFSVRAIMREQNNIPFAGKPVKTAYMWPTSSAAPRCPASRRRCRCPIR
ncbi:MAG: DsbA family protein [Reyranellales bacterium]|jgi:2-hydroxychromene-2-carboxylate isomerase